MAQYSIASQADLSLCIDPKVKELLQIATHTSDFETERRIIDQYVEIRRIQAKAEAEEEAKKKKADDDAAALEEKEKEDVAKAKEVEEEMEALRINYSNVDKGGESISNVDTTVDSERKVKPLENTNKNSEVDTDVNTQIDIATPMSTGDKKTVASTPVINSINEISNAKANPATLEIVSETETQPAIDGYYKNNAIQRADSIGEREALAAVDKAILVELKIKDEKVTAMLLETKCGSRDECIFYLDSADYDLSAAIELYKSMAPC